MKKLPQTHLMVRFATLAALLLTLLIPLPASAQQKKEAPPKPEDPGFPAYVLDRVDDIYRGRKSRGIMTMTIQTKHWKRSLTMESWSLGQDYSLTRIKKPKKEKGTATLKAQKDLFIYLNKTGRTIKISSSMLGGSWMGSHFTNDDLIHQSRLSRDYQMKLSFRGKEGASEVYRFTLQAKPDAAVVWDKILVTVRQGDLQPLRQEFFDEEGKRRRVKGEG